MKLAIIGSRSFNDYPLLNRRLDKLRDDYGDLDLDAIISGGAEGADSLGARFAHQNNIKLVEFLPDWQQWGKSAGFVRNKQIITNCDEVLAFWDGVSKGTAHSLKLARDMKKPTTIIYF